MHVLLDLYGVLLEHEKTFRGYRERLAALLAARFGREADAWRRAHDEAFVTYTRPANDRGEALGLRPGRRPPRLPRGRGLRGYPRIAPRPQGSPPPGGHAALRRGDLAKPRGPAAMGRDVDDVASLMTRARRTPGGASVRVPACGSPRSPRPGDRGSGGTDPRTRGQTRRSDC